MISIIKFRESVLQRAKAGTSGYDTEAEFIVKANEAQRELATNLAKYPEKNQTIKDAISVLMVREIKNTSAAGNLYLDQELVIRFVTMISAAGKPAHPVSSNELAIIGTSPIRKPSIEKDLIFYSQDASGFWFLPKVAMPIDFIYIRKPKDVKITLVPISDPDRDYVVPSTEAGSFVNFEWPETMFNILMYLTLEKLGMEMKEPILIEYANLGLQKEQLNIQP